jgi:hypothetical protein
LVTQFDALLQPVLYFRLHPPNPSSWTVPEAHTPWKLPNGFEPSNVLWAVQYNLPKFLLAYQANHRSDSL